MNRRTAYAAKAKDVYEHVVKPHLIQIGWKPETLDNMARRIRPGRPNYKDFCITDVTYFPKTLEPTWSDLERMMYANIVCGAHNNPLVLQAYATHRVESYAIVPMITLLDVIYNRAPLIGALRFNFTGVIVEDKSPRFWLVSFRDVYRLLNSTERKYWWAG